MDNTELCFTPATELARLIRDKAVSPVEVTDAVLARITQLESFLNAFAVVLADEAQAAAKAAEQAVMRGDTLGPLHGVPVTIKDLFDLEGVPTASGSKTRTNYVAPRSTILVERLIEAGAIALGKTTTSEYGWKGVSQSPLTGITSNPWRLGYNAGASSAGAGAAAAAGYGPSIRDLTAPVQFACQPISLAYMGSNPALDASPTGQYATTTRPHTVAP